MADARDLKSLVPRGMCGFESRRRQFFISLSRNRLNHNRNEICAVSVSFRTVGIRLLANYARQDQVRKRVPPGRKGRVICGEDLPGPKALGDYYRVVFYLGGKRHRLNFCSLGDAKEEATAKAAQLARGDVDAVQLTGRDRLTYGRAL